MASNYTNYYEHNELYLSTSCSRWREILLLLYMLLQDHALERKESKYREPDNAYAHALSQTCLPYIFLNVG